MTEERIDLDDALADLNIEIIETDLTDEYDRRDYKTLDSKTVVSVFTFADGSAIKAWTTDSGDTYTTRVIDPQGVSRLGSGRRGLSAADVNAQVSEKGERQ